MKKISVFLSARSSTRKIRDEVFEIGCYLGLEGYHVFYGGGYPGLMGTLAKGVERVKGRLTGVTTKMLLEKESKYKTPEDTIIVESMATRKMIELADADVVLVLTGGFGTLDELFEAVTLQQLRILQYRIVVYVAPQMKKALEDLFRVMVKLGTISEPELKKIKMVSDIEDLKKWV